jgi:hypothetical protein
MARLDGDRGGAVRQVGRELALAEIDPDADDRDQRREAVGNRAARLGLPADAGLEQDAGDLRPATRTSFGHLSLASSGAIRRSASAAATAVVSDKVARSG